MAIFPENPVDGREKCYILAFPVKRACHNLSHFTWPIKKAIPRCNPAFEVVSGMGGILKVFSLNRTDS